MGEVKDFRLPDLGEGLEEGEIVAWRVEVDDEVELNQTVADVETAKAVVEVPSPFAGRVVERLAEEGATLPVGEVLLRIEVTAAAGEAATQGGDGQSDAGGGDEDDEEPQPLVGYGEGRAGPARRRRRRGGGSGGNGEAASAKPLAKPPVRKLAKDLGVDLAAIAPGSGEGGVITREDVHAAAEGAPAAPERAAAPDRGVAAEHAIAAAPAADGRGEAPAPGAGFRGRVPGEVVGLTGVRGRIARHMEVSRREIPEATCSRDADVTELWELRRRLTEQARSQGHDVAITPFALVMRATVVALRRFPTLNARIVGREGDEGGEIELLTHVNLGFAADTERGLLVPNIKDAHAKSLLELATELDTLAGRARDGSITPGELTGGSFTVNNYGAFGNDDGDPIINHPEAGILGVGAMRERPWVVAPRSGREDEPGEIAVRRVARFTLAFDHRICDGGEAGRFVTYVAELCERPGQILLHA